MGAPTGGNTLFKIGLKYNHIRSFTMQVEYSKVLAFILTISISTVFAAEMSYSQNMSTTNDLNSNIASNTTVLLNPIDYKS